MIRTDIHGSYHLYWNRTIYFFLPNPKKHDNILDVNRNNYVLFLIIKCNDYTLSNHSKAGALLKEPKKSLRPYSAVI